MRPPLFNVLAAGTLTFTVALLVAISLTSPPPREPGTRVVALLELPPDEDDNARNRGRLHIDPPTIGNDGTVAFLSTSVPVRQWPEGINTTLYVAPPGQPA